MLDIQKAVQVRRESQRAPGAGDCGHEPRVFDIALPPRLWRARIALLLEICAAACIVVTAYPARQFGFPHPVGLMEKLYRWLPVACWILVGWLVTELIINLGRLTAWQTALYAVVLVLAIAIALVANEAEWWLLTRW
jgi:hypothetical protein